MIFESFCLFSCKANNYEVKKSWKENIKQLIINDIENIENFAKTFFTVIYR